eukprot:scaffold233548_cov46-Attheya_sp.AAC.1
MFLRKEGAYQRYVGISRFCTRTASGLGQSTQACREESTPTAGVLLGSGERAEGYVRRGIFYFKKVVVYLLV